MQLTAIYWKIVFLKQNFHNITTDLKMHQKERIV